MIAQGILPFKVEITSEEITPRSGLAVYSEVLRALGIPESIGEELPPPGSNRGYPAWQFVEPLLLMLHAGGRHIEDLREIEEDRALRRLIGLKTMPDTSTYGDWLVRMGRTGGKGGVARVTKAVVAVALKKDEHSDYTLDTDATVIEAEKEKAERTYKGVRGYQPILGFLAEFPLCVAYEFRPGNAQAGSHARRFLKRCLETMPRGKKIKRLRSDSAFYKAEVFNLCEEEGLGFTVTADQDVAVKQVITTIRDWKPLRTSEGGVTDREVGTAVHIMNKTKKPFRLVVQRWRDPQLPLFQEPEYRYYVVATNRDEIEAEEAVWFHNGRGQAENLIKELKIGFGMEQMVSGDFRANAVYFGIGVLAYNTAQIQKHLFMNREWRPKTMGTIRWSLVEIAGRVVRHGRALILRLATSPEKLAILLGIRQACLAYT